MVNPPDLPEATTTIYRIISGTIDSLTIPLNVNLRAQTYSLGCPEGKQAQVEYQHGKNRYIVVTQGRSLLLPIYGTEDIDTCASIEMEGAETNLGPLSEEAFERLIMYGGPKGNFHCDTPYACRPKWLMYSDGRSLFEPGTHQLTINTLMGHKYTFEMDQPMKVERTVKWT
jgi:redox-sensitive bicupin YhaK (pirin superfamily)